MRGRKREFSKIILAAVMGVYFIAFGFGVFVVAHNPELLGELLTFVGAPTAVAIGFYAWKAKAENVIKISAAVEDEDVLNAAIHNSESEGYNGDEGYYSSDSWRTDTDSSYRVYGDPAEDEVPRMAEIRRKRGGTPLG